MFLDSDDALPEVAIEILYNNAANNGADLSVGKFVNGGNYDIDGVAIWEGCEGLVHISQLSDKRVAKTSDVVSEGDDILVKATGYKNGKLNLSRKEVLVKEKIKDDKKEDSE
jgi:polyribonucleotide nucleotidyltransferase